LISRDARTIRELLGLGIVGFGIYGWCGCSRATSKHSEDKPVAASVTAAAPLEPKAASSGLPEDVVRQELRKMTAFFKWMSEVHGAIARQKYAGAPECEKGRCSATFEAPENQSYFVEWAKKDPRSVRFQGSFRPVKVACGDIDGQLVRTWRHASARKILCKGNSGGNVLIEMVEGAEPTTKFLAYTDGYLTIDPDFAAVVRTEGTAR